MERAKVLVWGATGFTGTLICEALARADIPFAAAGRNRERVDAVGRQTGAIESLAVDLGDADALAAAIRDRTIVCACAGPFAAIGEPVLATCARLGVHYIDTTGEQTFVAMSRARYRARAEASGACIVSAMAFEISLADFCAHLAFEALGEAPDEIACVYALRGGYVGGTTPATKRSAIGMAKDGQGRQFIDGELREEPIATVVRQVTLSTGKRLTAFSFPSPEAVDVPTHTGARTVRTFMVSTPNVARGLHIVRRFVPGAIRLASPILDRLVDRGGRGPSEDARRTSSFEVFAEARAGNRTCVTRVIGTDPYGLTAEIQRWAVQRALTSKLPAGVLAPSGAFPAREALEALEKHGISLACDGPLAS